MLIYGSCDFDQVQDIGFDLDQIQIRTRIKRCMCIAQMCTYNMYTLERVGRGCIPSVLDCHGLKEAIEKKKKHQNLNLVQVPAKTRPPTPGKRCRTLVADCSCDTF